jgi:phosphoesterase RecJ-like protein
VLLTAPATADGDSVGSQLALEHMFRRAFPEIEIFIVNDEPPAERYRSVSGIERLFTPEQMAERREPMTFDVGIAVDGGVDRSGRLLEVFDRCEHRVFIDHHAVSCPYPYTLSIVQPHATSTTEIIYSMSRLAPFRTPLVPRFAEWLYLGLVCDTAVFRNPNTTPEVLELAATLRRSGFDAIRCGHDVMTERSVAGLRLLADAAARAEFEFGGRVVWSTVTQARLEGFGGCPDDREGIVDALMATRGVEVAVLLFELPDGGTKVSFRSRGLVDVASVAEELGHGGGHRKAAGAELPMRPSDAAGTILRQLGKALERENRAVARGARHREGEAVPCGLTF